MKLMASLVVLCLVSLESLAQSPARIHFLNTTVGMSAELKTSLDPKKSVIVRSNRWVRVEAPGDSLGIVIDSKTYFLHFEPNKQYYFVVHSAHGNRSMITEKSEREFMLTAALRSTKGPEEYTIDKIAN